MMPSRLVLLIAVGLLACTSSGGTSNDAAPKGTGGGGGGGTGGGGAGGGTGGGGGGAPADAGTDGPRAQVAACTNINLSCYNPGANSCQEYSNADDATVATVTDSCNGGTISRGKCPPGITAGCLEQLGSTCENAWYYQPFDANFIAQFICSSNLILP
jgi:hypothetical protein